MADGRVFTGRQALTLKLVDELGEERDAIAWLEREKGVAKDLPVRDWEPRGELRAFRSSLGGGRRRSLRLRGPRRGRLRRIGARAPDGRTLTVSWRSGTLPSKNKAPSKI